MFYSDWLSARNQALSLALYLKSKGHEIHYLMNAHNGMTLKNAELHDGTKLDFMMYGEMMHSYFRNDMSRIIKENNLDRFIILLDTFMLHGPDAWFLGIDTAPAKTFFWFPTDGGGGLPVGCERILKKIDCPVAMSEFGKKQVKDYYNLDVKHIPHGVDSKLFYRMPEEERKAVKKKYGLSNKFVIGVVARNQPRKNLDRTIKLMAILKDKIPDAVLFLHMDKDDPANPLFRLTNLIIRYNLENRVFFTGMQAFHGLGNDQMNEVYNVMDCFLLTTSGEGFGIPIIEAMSCEIPVIATDYTTTEELVKNNKSGLPINLSGVETIDYFKENSKDYDLKVINGTITGSWEVERGICDIEHAAKQILYLYNNPEKAKRMGANGREAVLNKYDFKGVVGPLWEEVLK